ncbi:segregation/condensation protein A [Anaerofustis stercorihominis]|uniref:Segregation and condensation protein A n=1 Tax=Anaerofustis stercorihominis DSM 17244 TaxID=445971 RepID=B1C6S7_9FIRM|nr:segregation/condensation protein A [Anaerofustis stercorihominis]EDS72714.1 ScpA/B protein [Anaerofustis stercorihominis DSM 17244]MCQ4794088.1 segregation/condensation protein A [Anaerofustis stercorihominis]
MKNNILHLSSFEGPLDLLLHLISKNEIDIYDIPIVEITKQYLDYIYNLNDLDMEVASEFVVMASTLLEIKSKMLLPVEVDENEEEIDPREDLVARLIEYKAFKELTKELKESEKIYNSTVTKDPEYYSEIKEEYVVEDIDLTLLSKALRSILIKHKMRVNEFSENQTIETDTFSVDDSILTITKVLEQKEKISFFSLFKGEVKKGYVIATFLATLELLKMNMVKLIQNEAYDDILLERI